MYRLPTVTISSGNVNGNSTSTNPILLTFTTSKTTTDFDGIADDFTLVNGTLSNFDGSGTTYTADFTATTQDSPSITVKANAFTVSGVGKVLVLFIYLCCYSSALTLGTPTSECNFSTSATDETYKVTIPFTNVITTPIQLPQISRRKCNQFWR